MKVNFVFVCGNTLSLDCDDALAGKIKNSMRHTRDSDDFLLPLFIGDSIINLRNVEVIHFIEDATEA